MARLKVKQISDIQTYVQGLIDNDADQNATLISNNASSISAVSTALVNEATSTGNEIDALEASKVSRVVMCSGKVYYDLYEEREKRGLDDIYLLRLEQLYPFPAKALINELSRFANAEMVWCQEEPKNMGAWSFIDPYLEWVLAHINAKYQRVRYTGRAAAASTATGLMSQHLAQLEAFLEDALGN